MTRIETESQLDALPEGSVIGIVRSDELTMFEHIDGEWWASAPNGTIYRLDTDHLPAVLLYVPGRDLVQEAKAEGWDEGHQAGLDDAHDHALGLAAGRPNPYRNEAP